MNLVCINIVYLSVIKTIKMKRTLTRQDFEVIVDAQIYFVNFTYEETFFRNHSSDPYEEPEDITTSELLDVMKVSHYDEENNLIVSVFGELPEKDQEIIKQAVEEECRNYAEDE